ncbi:MAG: ribosome maturation factor RimP [Alphaproteobacteria bacterium]|nr:ribosome maturation factor RimP [Alphaproteobacteria bacterium]
MIDMEYAGYTHLVAPGAAQPLLPLLAPIIADMGYELLRIRMTGKKGSKTLQLMAHRPDGRMTVEDCAQISRKLSSVLDAENVIEGAYQLEISSPGLARPLCRPKDFTFCAGQKARIKLTQPLRGRKHFQGRLQGFAGDSANGAALLEVIWEDSDKPQIVSFALADIAEAQLVVDSN